METKFNFNSQICTNKIQSIRLLALGIKKETADMTIHIKDDGSWYVTAELFSVWEDDMNTLPSLEETEQILPAWSLHRLLELDDIEHIILDSKNEMSQLYDIVIDNIEAQIKGGKFPKEYLV